MLGLATGCYVDQTNLQSEADAPVTNYYIWLPYMLSLLFLLTKLPHILWKKFFENNLIRHLLGGEESWQELFIGPKNNGGGDGNNNDGNGKKGGDCNNKNKGNQGNKGKKFKIWKSAEIGKHFVNNHGKFTMYHCKYAFWESFNIVTILASVQITDWILNSQFWSYGWEVIQYLNSYQDRSLQLHDPMCQVFPTEVGCRYRVGVGNGFADEVVGTLDSVIILTFNYFLFIRISSAFWGTTYSTRSTSSPSGFGGWCCWSSLLSGSSLDS